MSEKRNFRLSHQTLCIRQIDFEHSTVLCYTELIIWPLGPLKNISLNCKQSRIFQILASPIRQDSLEVSNIELQFIYSDPTLEICKKDAKQRLLDNYCKNHEALVELVDSDEGNGELLIRLTNAELASTISRCQPLKIMIEYALQYPSSGLYFVVPPGEGSLFERGVHMFSAVYANSSRLWFPCVDSYSEPCTWKIEITVLEDLVAVSCGELIDIIYTDDLASKTYHYYVSQPVSAPNIAIAAGAFEIYPDPYMQEVTYFCPPKLLDLLKHTVTNAHDIFEFYEDLLSARYPFSIFKAVFVDQAYDEWQSYASFCIFSVGVLHSARIIEQTMVSRKIFADAIAHQFFGCYITMQNWEQSWLPNGLAGYLAALYHKKTFGNNEYRHLIASEMRQVTEFEQTKQSILLDPSESDDSHIYFSRKYAQAASPSYVAAYYKKAHLIIRMLELRVGQPVLLQVLNKLMILASLCTSKSGSSNEPTDSENGGPVENQSSLGNGSSNVNSPAPPLSDELRANLMLYRQGFVRIISTVTGHDIQNFVDQWVLQPGHVRIFGKFAFNKKRNIVELELKQEVSAKGAMKYAGPIMVTLQELDGPFNHNFKLEEIKNLFEINCHSKSRKHKKRKIPLSNGDEVDMDLSRADVESPVLWLRIDTDMTLLRHINLIQIDYMWHLMLRYEKDCVGQLDAVNALDQMRNHETRLLLTDVVADDRVFYRVRMQACYALCLVSNAMANSGTPVLLNTFQNMFGSPACKSLVRQNNFSNLQHYFLQKTIPRAMATLRTQQDVCPKEVLQFLVDLLKYNDNSHNRYSDCNYRAELIEAMKDTLTPAILGRSVISVQSLPPEVRTILEEVTRSLNMEKLIPTYKKVVTVACLRTIRKLQKMGFLPVDPSIFYSYAAPSGTYYDVRLAALNALVDHVRSERDAETLNWIFTNILDEDSDARLKFETVQLLIQMPLFQRQEKNPLDREALVERIWKYMNTNFPGDCRIRCALTDLYYSLYGRRRPSCIPIPEGFLVVNVREGKSRMGGVDNDGKADSFWGDDDMDDEDVDHDDDFFEDFPLLETDQFEWEGGCRSTLKRPYSSTSYAGFNDPVRDEKRYDDDSYIKCRLSSDEDDTGTPWNKRVYSDE